MAGTPFELKGKTVFVAGHKGLVGGALVRRLARENVELLTITRSDLDLRDQAAVFSWFADKRPQAVFLAAGKVGGIVANNTLRGEFIYDNLIIATNVIHAAHVKTERTARRTYRTRDDAQADVFDYIERFYNPKRRHSTIGFLSPMEFERQVKRVSTEPDAAQKSIGEPWLTFGHWPLRSALATKAPNFFANALNLAIPSTTLSQDASKTRASEYCYR